jgi:hypothetical protein
MKTTKGMKKIYAVRFNAVFDVIAKNKEDAEDKAKDFLGGFESADFFTGAINYYKIDSIKTDWVDATLIEAHCPST